MDTVEASEVEKFKPGRRLLAAFASIAVINLASALDATTISVALPDITVALNGTAIEAFWAGTSFLLTSTVWQPNFVTLSDLFGRRPMLIIALTFFTAGSILCAVSQNFTEMLVGRSIQGAGAGGILALTEAIITDLIPLRERGNYFALISIVWALGSVAGPLVGGVLADVGAWRWIFYLNLPFIAIGFAGIIAFLKLENHERSLKEKLHEIDYVGSVIFIASTTSFLIAVTWGGVMFSWSSWHTLVPLLLGLFGLVLFVLYDAKLAAHTLLPLGLFKNISTSIAYFLTFLHGIILWSTVYYMPLYFEGAQDFSPIIAGVSALPQALSVVPSAMVVGVIAARTGHYRWALWVGWFLATLGVGLLYLLTPNTNIPSWIFLRVFSGIGIGILFPTMALAIQASAPPKDIAIAAAMFTFFRAFGQTIGVAIGGVIFQNRIAANLANYPALNSSASSYSTDVVGLVQIINSMPSDDPETMMLKTAFSDSIRTIWAVMAGLAGVAFISSFFVKHYDLNQKLVTEQGFAGQSKPRKDDMELSSDVAALPSIAAEDMNITKTQN
ncbi:hypothetical protein MMC17_008268 [Xylographa soralifera]|nr:hypothetical protein [Xylographa soralifera]